MRRINIFIIAFLSMFVFLQNYNINTSKTYAFYDTHNCSEIVIEQQSGRILYQNNIHQKSYMASTTKILTAITIIENCNLEDYVLIDKRAVGIEGSSIYLRENESIKVIDLLYGLMLRSGNDCATALAFYCSNSIENFACLMNKTAEKIGAKESNFVNPHGLHNDNHYTTAYDLALISSYAMRNETFREIVNTKYKTIVNKDGEKRFLKNKNKILFDFEGGNGVKTGFTRKAGRCLVSSAKRGNMQLICVVLNCPSMFETSKTLLDNSFKDFKIYNILDNDSIFIDENTKKYLYNFNEINIPLTIAEFNNLTIKPIYSENNKKINSLQFYSQNNLIFEQKIFTI